MFDPVLAETVKRGDVKKLIKLCEIRSDEFFVGQDGLKCNVLHILCLTRNPRPCVEAILTRLSFQVVRQLICQTNEKGQNAIHLAAANGLLDIVVLLVDAYMLSDDGVEDTSRPPWRAKDNSGEQPVRMAVAKKHDEVAAFLISVDPDVLHYNVENAPSLLANSVFNGCRRTAKAILTLSSAALSNITGFDPRRITDAPDENCSESDPVLLLKQHPELAKCLHYDGKLVIFNQALRNNYVDIVKTLLDTDISLSSEVLDDNRCNSLHIAVEYGHLQIAQVLLDKSYIPFDRQVRRERERAAPSISRRSFEIREEDDLAAPGSINLSSFTPLWRQTNRYKNTPLHVAFRHGHIKLAASMLLWDLDFLLNLADEYEAAPTTGPIIGQNDFKEVTEHYLEPDVKHIVMETFLETFLQFLRENADYKSSKLIIQHPNLIELKDASGRSILQYALDKNEVQVISMILEIHPSAINTLDGKQEHLLIKASRDGNLYAIRAICHICPQAVHVLAEDQTTILHNVRLRGLEEYRTLLEITEIRELKNRRDALGRSPLIKAIQEDSVNLAQALLEVDGIDVMNIISKEGKTAAVMLKDKSKDNTQWTT